MLSIIMAALFAEKQRNVFCYDTYIKWSDIW